MPIVPNLAMPGSPAMPNAPAMERGGGVRVNANDALRGLGRVADSLAGMTPVPGVPEDLGQGRARGMAAIGQGVRDLGQARMEIEAEIAKARNYNLLSEASLAMEKEIGEFEKFKLSSPDPATWPAEWDRRLSEWPGRYMEGRDYPPAVKDAINSRILGQGQSYGIEVGIAAKKQEVATARANMKFEFSRAGSIEEVEALAATPEAKLWMHPVELEMTRLEAKDRLEAEQLDTTKNLVQADIDSGNYGVAKERIRLTPGLREDEKISWLSGIDKQERQDGFIREVDEIGYFNPSEGIAMLQARDENGDWANWKGMSDEARFKKAREFESIQANDWTKKAAEVSERIFTEGLTEEDLKQDPAFNALPKSLQAVTIERMRKGSLDAFMELSDFQARARQLDTRTHEGRIKAKEMLAEAPLRFAGDSAESAVAAVQSAIDNPKPLMPDAEAITMARSSIRDRFENQEFGRFKFTKAEIKEKTLADGTKGYFVDDPNPPQGFGYKERTKYLWGTSSLSDQTMRRIMLSPDEVKRYKDSKTKADTTFTDQVFYQAAGRKFIDAVEEVERNKEQGKYDSATSYGDELGRIMGVSKHEAFERRESSRLEPVMRGDLEIPSGGGLDTDGAMWPPALRNPVEKLNELRGAIEEDAPPTPTPLISITNSDAETQARFIKRIGASIPARIEDSISMAIDPVGVIESTGKLYDSVVKSIEEGTSISDVKNAISKSLSSPEAMADFYVDAISLLLTRNPKFSDTNLDEMAIGSLAAQNVPGSEVPDPGYIPGAILLAAIKRANKRVKDENEKDFGKERVGPTSGIKAEQAKGAVLGPKKSGNKD